KFGQAVDTSIIDTGVLLKSYFGITSAVVHTSVTIEDIKRALADHQIVIVPTDGRKLQNPHFKQPGPPRHMLVIIGYNDETREFTVNDPGTRKGQGYRYPQTVLFDALLDYATGKHIPVASADKVMLTVSRY
nr:C39 family peptidase [Candidatus Moranbacteria bacterium]